MYEHSPIGIWKLCMYFDILACDYFAANRAFRIYTPSLLFWDDVLDDKELIFIVFHFIAPRSLIHCVDHRAIIVLVEVEVRKFMVRVGIIMAG